MKALGAVFGSVFGWERPNWFAPPGYELTTPTSQARRTAEPQPPAGAAGERPREKWWFRRSNYFDFVGAECRNVMEVGLQDMRALPNAGSPARAPKTG